MNARARNPIVAYKLGVSFSGVLPPCSVVCNEALVGLVYELLEGKRRMILRETITDKMFLKQNTLFGMGLVKYVQDSA